MNQTESIKAYLEEKASKHKISYTDIPKYQELIEGYLMVTNRFCSDCKHYLVKPHTEPCKSCIEGKNAPNWQKA